MLGVSGILIDGFSVTKTDDLFCFRDPILRKLISEYFAISRELQFTVFRSW